MLSLIVFFPGSMSFDSLYQYRQAIGLVEIDDSHPVIMAYLWRGLIRVIPGPGSLLIFHQLAFWLACAIFATSIFEKRRNQILCLIILGFWPPLYIHSLILWKDVGMMVALMLCVAALSADIKKPNWKWLAIAAVSLFYGFAVCHNAFTGTAILVGAMAWRCSVRVWCGKSLIYGTLISTFILLLGYAGVSQAIKSDKSTGILIPAIIPWDMAALSIAEDKNLIPSYVIEDHNLDVLDRLKAAYHSKSNVTIFKIFPLGPTVDASPIDPNISTRQLLNDWFMAIRSNPVAYLKHRMHVL